MTSLVGEKYVGEWKNGKKNGQGTETFFDGRKYVGEWKNGKKHAQGTMTLSSGGKYVGEWKDGKRWNGTMNEKDGTIDYKVVNWKKIKQ